MAPTLKGDDLLVRLEEMLLSEKGRLRDASLPKLDDPEYEDPSIWLAEENILTLKSAIAVLREGKDMAAIAKESA